MIVGIECQNDADMPLAEDILSVLVRAYPGHAWFVYIAGGVVHIKNMDWSEKWGMALHQTKVHGDPVTRKRDVIRAAGEFLERANVARGAKTDQRVIAIEGVPDRHVRAA